MQSLVIAEDFDEDGDKQKTPEKILAEQEARKAARMMGLHRLESLDIFSTWYAFGGMQHGLSPTQAAEMPAWLRDDFRFLIGELGHARKEREDKKPKKPPPAPKPTRRIARK